MWWLPSALHSQSVSMNATHVATHMVEINVIQGRKVVEEDRFAFGLLEKDVLTTQTCNVGGIGGGLELWQEWLVVRASGVES